jgi:putative FmdB family regulatory protein
MPIYEYECEKCSCKFELLRSVKEDGGASCPECQSHSPRVFSRMSYIWKGTRYASEKVSKKESGEPKEKSTKKPEDNKNTEKGKKNDE